jgi:hypothetical protein
VLRVWIWLATVAAGSVGGVVLGSALVESVLS